MIEVNIFFLLEKGNFTKLTVNLSLNSRVIFNVWFSQRNSRNQIFIQVINSLIIAYFTNINENGIGM